MESLEEFVNRLSKSIGCYFHLNKSGFHSMKKYNSNQPHQMGVLGWVSELKRKNLFRVDTYKRSGDKAGVSIFADGSKENMHFNKDGTGIFFYVEKGSQGEDYEKAVKAMKAIVSLRRK